MAEDAIDPLVARFAEQCEYGGEFFDRALDELWVSEDAHWRLRLTEKFLHRIAAQDPVKYKNTHKGTPFYFLARDAFECENYSKALHYLDAAVAEDSSLKEPLNHPAGWFLLLDDAQPGTANPTIRKAKGRLDEELERFRQHAHLNAPTIEDWTEQFAKKLVVDKRGRSILCGLYVFLMEFETRKREIEVRGETDKPRSNQAFLSHLMLGGLCFESLLKLHYGGDTIGEIYSLPDFKTDFGLEEKPKSSAREFDRDHVLRIIAKAAVGSQDKMTAFAVTAQVRNTVGHDLGRDDIFDEPGGYRALYEQILNAIFFVVERKYCAPGAPG